ncbi:universal stress protein [Streptomyces wuyuanensis]|uniref:universal stress protein n=1 Tax=Streptomyces wuyuanensis TaxID=1196353 RepID=UPI00342E472F
MTSGSGVLPIMYGVDAAQPADAALDWAADEAARRGARLHLVHAVLPVTHHVRGVEETAHHKAMRALGEEALDKAAGRARERHPHLDVTMSVVPGNPAPVLVRKSAHAQSVVLGSRRLGRLAEVLSVASTVVPVSAHAACPVVVVPEAERTVEEPPFVVVGVDDSESADAAVDYACGAAARAGASVRAVWAWQRPRFGFWDEEAAMEACERHLYAAAERRSGAWADVALRREVLSGHPVDVLADAAEHALALVVGRRGHEGFAGMRLGSVPHGLLHRALCPVVTVPARFGHGTS